MTKIIFLVAYISLLVAKITSVVGEIIFNGCDQFSAAKITFVVDKTIFKVTVITLSVAKITFEVVESTLITSSVAKSTFVGITFFVADINLLMAKISFEVVEIIKQPSPRKCLFFHQMFF